MELYRKIAYSCLPLLIGAFTLSADEDFSLLDLDEPAAEDFHLLAADEPADADLQLLDLDEPCVEIGYRRPRHLTNGNSLTVSAELYHVRRKKEGGTGQSGNAAGIRFNYDYIKRYNIYVGGQLFYGCGTLHGHTGADDKIRSKLKTSLAEGNLGYTFQMKCFPHLSFTPYGGFGCFREVNKFTPPSPLQVSFTTKFRYVSFGFLSSTFFAPSFSVGFNARFKYPWQPRCHVSGDPSHDAIKQIINEKIQWRLELPITYFGEPFCTGIEAALMPFYEYQSYGARENYPFDFFKTTYSIYGIDFQFIYRF